MALAQGLEATGKLPTGQICILKTSKGLEEESLPRELTRMAIGWSPQVLTGCWWRVSGLPCGHLRTPPGLSRAIDPPQNE